jgi:hypothetical protein
VQSLALGAYHPPFEGYLPKQYRKGQQEKTNKPGKPHATIQISGKYFIDLI